MSLTLKSDLHSSSLASLDAESRTAILAGLSDDDALALLYDWPFWARDKQLPPEGDWDSWLILAGRGFGKTRTGAELVRWWAENGVRYIGIIGATASDVRDVMIEGESGILAVSAPWFTPVYEPSKRRLTWPNGAIGITRSADEPNRLRGPQYEKGWADELAAWRYPEAWDQFMFGLRLGERPQVVVTTTPRPTRLIRDLVSDPHNAVTTGTTFENASNVAPSFLTKLLRKYQGTRLGRQELYAAILDDTPGALWTLDRIDATRVHDYPDLVRLGVAIDPATTSDEESDETGIIVGGVAANGHGYVLADLSLRDTPAGWAREALAGYHKFKADRMIAEANQGGDMIEQTIKSVLDAGERMPPYKKVHASRGKATRAEPVSALYEQGLIHHVGSFPELEDQMTTWVPGDASPDRMDALVWLFTELLVDGGKTSMGQSRARGLYPERRGRREKRRR